MSVLLYIAFPSFFLEDNHFVALYVLEDCAGHYSTANKGSTEVYRSTIVDK